MQIGSSLVIETPIFSIILQQLEKRGTLFGDLWTQMVIGKKTILVKKEKVRGAEKKNHIDSEIKMAIFI